jgi:hypothetical protein
MRRKLAVRFSRVSVLLAGVAIAPGARAAPPPSLRVGAEEGACPTAGQVAEILKRLLPRTKVFAEAGPFGPEDAAIFDQGSLFRVTVAGQDRSFVDATRVCAERAQHAAVFIALVLDPPTIAEPPEAAVTVPAAPIAPEPARAPPVVAPPATQWELTLGGLLLVAPSVHDRETAVASGVAAWVRGKRGFHLGFGAGLLRGSLRYNGAEADAWWIPIDVAVGFTVKTSVWEVGGEIGPSAGVLSIVGVNLEQVSRQVRVELGGRASALSRFWFSQNFALFLSADALLRPVPYALRISPEGEVGRTPWVWLGASAGLGGVLE